MADLSLNSDTTGTHQLVGLNRAVCLGIIASFAVIIVLSYTKNVNWDEFYFLSHVHAFVDGRLDRPLQTFFVRAFSWLAQVPGHEMEQIFAARLVMVGLLGVTALSIHRIAHHFTDKQAANIAVLAFMMSGFVLAHGASFRSDPIAAALLTSSIALILTTQMKLAQIVIVALLSALALLVTIKAALYAPVYLAAMISRGTEKGMVVRILASGVIALCLFAALYTWHAAHIVSAPGNDTATNMRDAASTSLLRSGLFPRAPYILAWALLSVGPIVFAIIGLTTRRSVKIAVLLALLASPLLSVIVYRNAFPYFFPFATPLLMITVAFGAQSLQHSAWLKRLVTLMLVTGAFQFTMSLREDTVTQRATIAEVHRLFPEQVPYIDDSSMIASFPSVAMFMSTWGMQNYRTTGQPVFSDLISTQKPPLLITNKQTMIMAMHDPDNGYLLPEDNQALHNTYVQYNGAIWLAGREITLTDVEHPLTLPFAGQYRVKTSAPIEINGQRINDGDTISLDVQAAIRGAAETQVKLIWDTGVPPLQTDLPIRNIYAHFWAYWP